MIAVRHAPHHTMPVLEHKVSGMCWNHSIELIDFSSVSGIETFCWGSFRHILFFLCVVSCFVSLSEYDEEMRKW